MPNEAETALNNLREMLNDGETSLRQMLEGMSIAERIHWGNLIANQDPRPGVGLTSDGLPDIDWVQIPNEGKRWIYQGVHNYRAIPAFSIARYPITYRQFQVFVDAKDGWGDKRWWEGLKVMSGAAISPRSTIANHPREAINWHEAMAFCRWFSYQLTGQIPSLEAPFEWVVRLPTDAEWEKAARGTDGRKYPYGDEFNRAYGNYYVNWYYANGEEFPGPSNILTSVGIFPEGASPYGVLDMSGNVWEWCLGMHTRKHRIKTATTPNQIRLRGGSAWYLGKSTARTSYQSYGENQVIKEFFGFRICKSIWDGQIPGLSEKEVITRQNKPPSQLDTIATEINSSHRLRNGITVKKI